MTKPTLEERWLMARARCNSEMTEAEQNIREVCRKLGNSEASFDYKDNIIREVALATLKDVRPYLELANKTAEERHDNADGDDYMSRAMYDIMQDTERLIEQIDLLLQVASE